MRAAACVVVTLLFGTTLSMASVGVGSLLPSHPADACSSPYHVQGAGWDLCWQQDNLRAQGIELNRVYFQGEPVIWKIGIPFTLTQYEADAFGPFKDILGEGWGQNPGFGMGVMQIHPDDCPRFLGSGTLLHDRRVCVEHRDGPEPAVAIWGRYNVFNYRFLQGYILDSRGTVEPFLRLGGTLIDGSSGADGTNHFHHVYWRVDFDIGAEGNDQFEVFLRPDDAHTPFRDINSLPPQCKRQIRDGLSGWCPIEKEGPFLHHPNLFTKWRVQDPVDMNPFGRGKSYEAHLQASAPVDGNFTTFDVLVVDYKGDSMEIGFEVPARPLGGDAYVKAYADPAETIQDPVVWFAVHAYHDTRDEERPTLSYHHVSFSISPRNFFGHNPGEDSYDARTPTLVPPPPIIQPGT